MPPRPQRKNAPFQRPQFRQIATQDLPLAEFTNKQVSRRECDGACWVSARLSSLLLDISLAISELGGERLLAQERASKQGQE